MPHPVRYVSPSGPLLLAPKRVYPLLPPPPPPPTGLYKSMSPPLPACWAPLGIMCSPGPIPVPIPALGPTSTREQQKERKLICIRDPSTGQDVTQEILHQSCPVQIPQGSPPNLGQRQMSPPPFMDLSQLMFPSLKGSLPSLSWYEPPHLPTSLPGRRSPPCLCCSAPNTDNWQELFGLTTRKSIGVQAKQYSREFLLSLRNQPLSLTPPKDLPDLTCITKPKSPCSQASGDSPSGSGLPPSPVLSQPYFFPPGPKGMSQRRGRGSYRTSFNNPQSQSSPRTALPVRSRSLSLGQDFY